MKAQDINNEDNERGRVLRALRDFCADQDLEYSYTEKKFTVKLPALEELPAANLVQSAGKRRKRFDITKWGNRGPVEGEDGFPDELPPTTTPLEEGEPPEGDDEK